jgi:hypothetical protein
MLQDRRTLATACARRLLLLLLLAECLALRRADGDICLLMRCCCGQPLYQPCVMQRCLAEDYLPAAGCHASECAPAAAAAAAATMPWLLQLAGPSPAACVHPPYHAVSVCTVAAIAGMAAATTTARYCCCPYCCCCCCCSPFGSQPHVVGATLSDCQHTCDTPAADHSRHETETQRRVKRRAAHTQQHLGGDY